MKKLLFIFIFLLGIGGLAQQTDKPVRIDKNIIKTDVTELLLTTRYHLNVSWEHLMSKKAGLQLDFLFSNYGDDLVYDDLYAQLGVSYRFYFNKHANMMKGFYVAPAVRLHWRYAAGSDSNHDYNALYPTGGINLGYQWLIKKKWTLDLYADWQVNLRTNRLNAGYGSLGIKFGYKF